MKRTALSASVFSLMQQKVWSIAPVAPVAGSAGGGQAGAGATAASFASPEHLPDLTFVAEPRETDNGFIRTAFLYHDTYGLNPTTVASFEEIITQLSQQSTPIKRLRIVSHFFFDSTGKVGSNMNMAFSAPSSTGQAAGQVPR